MKKVFILSFISIVFACLGQTRRAALFGSGFSPSGGGGGGGPVPTPTAYWNFDASAGSDESDQTGNGVTLWQSNSAASVSGVIGSARSFQSNSLQYFVASNSVVSFSNTSWSILTWQKTYPTNVAGGIVSRFINTFPNREWYLYRQGSGGNNHRYYIVYGTNGASSYVHGNAATTRVPTNLWHLVGITVDSTNLQLRTVVMWGTTTNWTTNSLPNVYSTNGNANLIFGRDIGNGLYNDGAVDETGYWKGSALNEDQIGWYFNSGSGRSYPW